MKANKQWNYEFSSLFGSGDIDKVINVLNGSTKTSLGTFSIFPDKKSFSFIGENINIKGTYTINENNKFIGTGLGNCFGIWKPDGCEPFSISGILSEDIKNNMLDLFFMKNQQRIMGNFRLTSRDNKK
ncbi:MAG: hypothetical protein JRJ49_10750 [Deltaproteobacteria bacterium]|nr:hypothetical protein [Deltaproteobacteria bacterium]